MTGSVTSVSKGDDSKKISRKMGYILHNRCKKKRMKVDIDFYISSIYNNYILAHYSVNKTICSKDMTGKG